jgi:hypothetical protein
MDVAIRNEGIGSSCSKLYKLDHLVYQTGPYGFIGTDDS